MAELTLEWLQPDGKAGGRDASGRIWRVGGALPGDRVRVREAGREEELEAVLTPSPDRQTPPCPHDAQCGGCDLAALPLANQLALKARMVQTAFRLPNPPGITPSPRPTGHRARVQLGISGSQVGYRAARAHDLVAIDTCGVARPELNEALGRLRAWLATAPAHPFTRVELRSDGQRAIFAFQAECPLSAELRASLAELGDVAIDGKALHGEPTLWLDNHGLAMRASPRTFYQVNLEANAALVAWVRERVLAAGAERVLDLYAGIGNLDLPLAARGLPVVAVESEGQALGDLRASAERAGLSERVQTIVGNADRFDPSRVAFDAVILDPPRAGAPGLVDRLIRNRPRAIAYVACHAPSAARDLRAALGGGYDLAEVHCFDLFPDTHHVETVAWLTRRAR